MIEKMKWNFKSPYNFYVVDSIPSTNTYLKNNGDFYPDRTVLIALEQTMGRGRYDRVWESKDDIIFSILLKKDGPYALIAPLAIVLGLKEFGYDTKIKWPNDIYLDGYKLSGILIEDIFRSSFLYSVIGIGINITDKKNYKGIGLNTSINHNVIIDTILAKFDLLNQMPFNEIIKLYRDKSMVIGKEVYYHDKLFKAIHVDSEGHLVLQNENETITISCDEINIKEAIK